MKNSYTLFGIIALIAVIIFLMTACPNDSEDNGGNGGSGSGVLGSTLNLSGQVYTYNVVNEQHVFERFNGNRTVSAVIWTNNGIVDIGGSGEIVNGQLSFSIDTPNELFHPFGWYDFNNINISPIETQGYTLDLVTNDGELFRHINTPTTYEFVRYIYVDRDATYSADITGEGTYIINAFTIYLSAGWNVIHQRGLHTGSINDGTWTYSVSVSNPSNLRWVYF